MLLSEMFFQACDLFHFESAPLGRVTPYPRVWCPVDPKRIVGHSETIRVLTLTCSRLSWMRAGRGTGTLWVFKTDLRRRR